MPRKLRTFMMVHLLMLGSNLMGQSASSQIEFRADNDFWFSTDRYYTTGSLITYRWVLKRDTTVDKTVTVAAGLRQQLYTPSDIRSEIVRQYDRPYAGFLGLSGTYTLIQGSEFFISEGLLGVAGPASGAEEFQNLFHENGGIDTPPWTAQIENSFHANLYAKFGQEWLLSHNTINWILAAQPGLAVGTRDIYFNPEVALYFGKRNKASESMAYHQLGPLQDELFLRLITTYRFVFHDAMLEGNFLGDDSPFLVEANKHLFKFALEACWRWGKNDMRVGYHYTSSETPLAENHAFGLLSYARSFN